MDRVLFVVKEENFFSNSFRKHANREFRRLYHLEEKYRHQLLVDQENELNEQDMLFDEKREDILRRFDGEIQSLEEKYSRSMIDRLNYLEEKNHLFKQRDDLLDQLEEETLRSRYDLFRKQTKSFYSFFRQMLQQQSIEQLKQFDEQAREQRRTLQAYLTNERNLWMDQWTRNRPKRYEQFMNREKLDQDRDYLLRKVIKLS